LGVYGVACVIAGQRSLKRRSLLQCDNGLVMGLSSMRKIGEFFIKRSVLLSGLMMVSIISTPSLAETCISPYIKALKQPEKVMYLWTLSAEPGGGTRKTFGTCAKKMSARKANRPDIGIGSADRANVGSRATGAVRLSACRLPRSPLQPGD
jgi:hypothetical protein